MKLFDYYYDYDYGYDFYVIIGQFRRFNLLDIIVHTSEYWSWSPDFRLTISILDGKVFSVDVNLWSLSFSIDLITYRCPMNLSHTRK